MITAEIAEPALDFRKQIQESLSSILKSHERLVEKRRPFLLQVSSKTLMNVLPREHAVLFANLVESSGHMITQACLNYDDKNVKSQAAKKKHPLAGSPFQFGLCIVREIALGARQDRLKDTADFFAALDPIGIDFLLAMLHRWANFAGLVLKLWPSPEQVLERLDFAVERVLQMHLLSDDILLGVDNAMRDLWDHLPSSNRYRKTLP